MLVEPQACLACLTLPTGVAEVVEPLPCVCRHMLLQAALLWKPFSTGLTLKTFGSQPALPWILLSAGLTLKTSAVFLLNVLVQLVLLLEPTLAVVALG